jgi:hypothetical protein
LGASQVGFGGSNTLGGLSPSRRLPHTPSPTAFRRRRTDLSADEHPPAAPSSELLATRFTRDTSWRSRGDSLPLSLRDDASPSVGLGQGLSPSASAVGPHYIPPSGWRNGDASRRGYHVDVFSGSVAASPTANQPPPSCPDGTGTQLQTDASGAPYGTPHPHRHSDVVTQQRPELVDDARHRSLTSIGGPDGPAGSLPAAMMHDFEPSGQAPRFGPRAAPMELPAGGTSGMVRGYTGPLRDADPTWSSGLSWAEMSRRGYLPKSMDTTRSEGLLDLSPSRKAAGHMFAR